MHADAAMGRATAATLLRLRSVIDGAAVLTLLRLRGVTTGACHPRLGCTPPRPGGRRAPPRLGGAGLARGLAVFAMFAILLALRLRLS